MVYEQIKNGGTLTVKVKKAIDMGHQDDSDIEEFVDGKYLTIDKNGIVYIKEGIECQATYLTFNGFIQLSFDDGESSYDIACDNDEDYGEFLEVVGA